MRIGILTYHSVFNFGANLQAYSSYSYLKNNGFTPIIIDYVPIELEQGYKKGNIETQANAHYEFVNAVMEQTNKCRNTTDVARAIEQYNIEGVLIGSDAVLQHKPLLARMYLTKKGIKFKPRRSNVIFPNPFWGSFIDELKHKIPVSVMSASSQNMNFNIVRGVTKRNIGKALKKFTHVTVRDDWTRQMVQYFTHGHLSPGITPDPVFAFNLNVKEQPGKEDILKKFGIDGKYVLFSFKHHDKVNKQWLYNSRDYLADNGYEAVYLTMPGGIVYNDLKMKKAAPPLSPIDWYALIKHANGYIGENMHPVIVAMHNAVPFFSFDTYGIVKYKYFVNEKSSKIYHILNKAGFIENRISTLGKSYRPPNYKQVIDKVLNFNTEKCRKFSQAQQNAYIEMMKLLTSFKA